MSLTPQADPQGGTPSAIGFTAANGDEHVIPCIPGTSLVEDGHKFSESCVCKPHQHSATVWWHNPLDKSYRWDG
jgi:hypothetical protein